MPRALPRFRTLDRLGRLNRRRGPVWLHGLIWLCGHAARVRARLALLRRDEAGYTSEAVVWAALAVVAAAAVAGLIFDALNDKAHEIVRDLGS